MTLPTLLIIGPKYAKHQGGNVKPIHIFLPVTGGTGKSYLVKTIYNVASETLLFNCKEPEKPIVLLPGPAGIPVVNVGGTTIHSALAIKPGAKLLGLSDKLKTSSKNQLSEVKLVMINDISMLFSDLWTDIDARLFEIFLTSIDLSFPGLVISYYHQLPPVKGRFIFSRFTSGSKMNQVLSWYS